MARRSVMEHNFSEVPKIGMPRSSFDRSHGHKTTMDCDFLVPILVDDIIPGDTFSCGTNFVVKLASPTILPLLDNLVLTTFAFFTPYRILWKNWEKFMGSQEDPGDSIDFTIPGYDALTTKDLTNATTEDYLADYMGLPHVSSFNGNDASALPFRAYNMIWNDWFRDENLQNSLEVPEVNGPDTASDYTLQKRGKRFDYFTSCLPFPQKGSAVDLPLGVSAVVNPTVPGTSGPLFQELVSADAMGGMNQTGTTVNTWTNDVTNGLAIWEEAAGAVGLTADLSTAVSATINDWRLALQTQALLEVDARSGTRYAETLQAHWKVSFPDYRLQRPEYLGGGRTTVSISPIAQTTYQGTQTIEDAKGALGGIGSVNGTHHWTKSFVEHGVLIILANVSGDITYSQGLERYWQKKTRYEFMYPILTGIGEQSVLNNEIFYQNVAADYNVFGYIGRYDEYRYKPSRLSGLMRPDNAASLEAFHLSEDFSALPTLSSSFIESNTGTPLDRAISVPTQPQFICDWYFDLKCARPMPTFGIPANLARF